MTIFHNWLRAEVLAVAEKEVEKDLCPLCYGAGQQPFTGREHWSGVCPVCEGDGKRRSFYSYATREFVTACTGRKWI